MSASSTTLPEKVLSILQANPNTRYDTKTLMQKVIDRYADDLAPMQARYPTVKHFQQQLAASIGSFLYTRGHKLGIKREQIHKRAHWSYMTNATAATPIPKDSQHSGVPMTEQDMYPALINYLKKQHHLHPFRINERRSSNANGSGFNKWLHPDIVAFELLNKDWHADVSTFFEKSASTPLYLWSFEVKKTITPQNVRECFFQTVSNSSWANLSYLVTQKTHPKALNELQVLCPLHGIGLMELNMEHPERSKIIIPARISEKIDWASINRLVLENADFKHYIQQINICLRMGKNYLQNQ